MAARQDAGHEDAARAPGSCGTRPPQNFQLEVAELSMGINNLCVITNGCFRHISTLPLNPGCLLAGQPSQSGNKNSKTVGAGIIYIQMRSNRAGTADFLIARCDKL